MPDTLSVPGGGSVSEVPSATTPQESAIESVHDTPTLLEDFVSAQPVETTPTQPETPVATPVPTEAPKPDATPAPTEAPKPDVTPAPTEAPKPDVTPAPTEAPKPRTYEDFKFPEGTQGDPVKMAAYKEVLGQHGISQEAGQALIDLHNAAMAAYGQHVQQEQHRAFNDTRKAWRTQVLADEQIGGSGHQTAMTAVARARDLFASPRGASAEQRAADLQSFNTFMRITGAGDHPAFLKFLHNVARIADEGVPLATPVKPSSAPTGGNRRPLIYDHPRSNANRGS